MFGSIIPIADNAIPLNASLCRQDDLRGIAASQIGTDSAQEMDFMKGMVLYPAIDQKDLTFLLLSCNGYAIIKMPPQHDLVTGGDVVIAGWRRLAPRPETVHAALVILLAK